jgi:UDP-N-acetylmuramoyl-tripeptide--D-alanyl-D-alanine ligase
MQVSMGEVAAILGASCDAPERIAQGFSIDSRTILPGQAFFAIRGPRLDGHQFVKQALERGAAFAVVERSFQEQAEPALAPFLLPARDTTEALQQLAHAVRRKWGRRLVAVTGSTGKTTTKELIAALLARRFAVYKSLGNLNNFFGLPLALLGLESRHEVAVVELAMSAAREIASLARIASPQIGVVTNVAPVHLQFFDSLDSIALAKRELIDNLESPATAVLNYDDSRVRQFAEGFAGRVVTFGFGKGAELRATELCRVPKGGSKFLVTGPEFTSEFYLPLPGRHNVENALAALATATLFEIPPAELQQALGSFQNLHQRSEILTLPGEITVINDSYNSNPLAMERMLETLAAWPQARRRIVVAGEMLELGQESPAWHRRIGRKSVECGADWLLAIHGDARFFIEGAAEAGLPDGHSRFFSTAAEAGEYCLALLEPGDVVLVKGSRGVHLETVTGLLEAKLGKSPGPSPGQGGVS